MIQVAVIGAGYWGPNLIRNLQEMGALAVVCDRDPVRLEAIRSRWDVGITTSLDEVLDDAAIGGVIVATPAATHHPIALRALEAGKHVFVEKPLALHAFEAEGLAAVAGARGLTLMVGHLLEYHPAFLALKERIEAGDLGELRHIRCTRFNLGKIRSEENVLWSFAPHDLSLVLRLTKRDPIGVTAAGLKLLGTPLEDTVYTDLDFGDNLKAHIQVSWLEPFKAHQFLVVGTRKMAVFNDILQTGKLKIYDRGFDQVGDRFAIRDAGEEIVEYPPSEPMRAELQDFLTCAETGAFPLADAESGIRVVRALESITAAIRAGDRESALPL